MIDNIVLLQGVAITFQSEIGQVVGGGATSISIHLYFDEI